MIYVVPGELCINTTLKRYGNHWMRCAGVVVVVLMSASIGKYPEASYLWRCRQSDGAKETCGNNGSRNTQLTLTLTGHLHGRFTTSPGTAQSLSSIRLWVLLLIILSTNAPGLQPSNSYQSIPITSHHGWNAATTPVRLDWRARYFEDRRQEDKEQKTCK